MTLRSNVIEKKLDRGEVEVLEPLGGFGLQADSVVPG